MSRKSWSTFSVIQSGKVKFTVDSVQGKEAVVAMLETNDFFGEGCRAGQAQRIATVATMTDSVIARLEKAAIVRWFIRNQRFLGPSASRQTSSISYSIGSVTLPNRPRNNLLARQAHSAAAQSSVAGNGAAFPNQGNLARLFSLKHEFPGVGAKGREKSVPLRAGWAFGGSKSSRTTWETSLQLLSIPPGT
jgi:hypothetical protein